MGDTFNLLHFTDPHLFADRAGVMRGVCTLETLNATVDAARSQHWPPDAIVVTGDIAQDESRGAYRLFRECFTGLGVPVYCLPGNHDNVGFMRELLDDPPFQFCGHLEHRHWIVPMLNTHRPGKASGALDDDELQRLTRLLARYPDRHFLVALHHHPVPTGSRWLDTVPLRNADDLFAITNGAEQVRCLLWGHVHQESRERHGRLLMLATPSTCSQFARHSDDFALDTGRPPAYRWLRLSADGSIDTAVSWCGTAPGVA